MHIIKTRSQLVARRNNGMHLTNVSLIPLQSQEADNVLSLKSVLSKPGQQITNFLKQFQSKFFQKV